MEWLRTGFYNENVTKIQEYDHEFESNTLKTDEFEMFICEKIVHALHVFEMYITH